MENIIIKTFKLALSVNDVISTVKVNGDELDCIEDLQPISTPSIELVNASFMSGQAGKKETYLDLIKSDSVEFTKFRKEAVAIINEAADKLRNAWLKHMV